MSFIGTQTTDVRSLRNIMTQDGKPCTATATENIWVGGAPFSEPSIGNEVTPFTTGNAYFSALIAALKAAQNTIYITGWQINWDAQLDAQGTRLFDVLLEAAKNNKNLKIYVMPWDDTAPLQTYDDQTAAVLLLIKKLVDRECVFVTLATALADENASFFSHHQKQVVIDGKIGFVGGIDLAYGRYDDATYDLHANAEGRVALNRYNGCVLSVGVIAPASVVDTDLLTGPIDRLTSRGDIITAIEKGAHQTPYAEDSPTDPRPPGVVYTTLDPKSQPRLPWQDVHVQIAGPAVADLALNFVLRWNSIVGNSRLPLPPPAASHPAGSGSCMVQVLRSAPRRMCMAEYYQVFGKARSRLPMPDKAQSHIAAAMEILIDKAHHFIYIENQFFVSGFGKVDGIPQDEYAGPAAVVHQAKKHGVTVTRTMTIWDVDKPPQNKICELLIKRINAQIIASPNLPFHVYITLPVHSEGMLNNGAVMTQIHWTMQSLVFGTNSLLNGIRRSLKARALLDKKDKDWKRVYANDNAEYIDIPFKECFKYVTLLNLRNWAKIGDRYVTEQIYVHSKLMIVDDRFALLGSANINDRSLLGSRDSELAVLIMDTDVDKADLCGDGKQRPTRGFARKLRQEVWNKLFGITAGGDRAAIELKQAVDSPGDPKSWEAIQQVAEANTKLYEAAFDFIPRNKDTKGTVDPKTGKISTASIWPRWHAPVKENEPWTKAGPMPFDKTFWPAPQFNASAAVKLTGVKGFITLLPIEWTMGENNNIGYATILVTVNDKKTTTPFPQANTWTVLNEPAPNSTGGKA